LFTRRSIGPSASRASATRRSTSSSRARSARIATARPPSASMAATVSWIVPGSRSSNTASVRAATATAAPSRAKVRAIASPMPRLAPVTIATRPASRSLTSPSGRSAAGVPMARARRQHTSVGPTATVERWADSPLRRRLVLSRDLGETAMDMNDLILVSVDDHVVEPPDMWERHVSKADFERAPRVIHKAEIEADVWTFEGAEIPNVGLNAVAGRPPEEYGFE